jgi:hypothetical protein
MLFGIWCENWSANDGYIAQLAMYDTGFDRQHLPMLFGEREHAEKCIKYLATIRHSAGVFNGENYRYSVRELA